MNRIVIVAGGILEKTLLEEIQSARYVIGVDWGAYWLITNSVIPDIAIGDFDSVNHKEFQLIKQRVKEVKEYPKEKDFTDTELAVEHALSLHPTEVIIYGAIGSRLDHTMGNMQLLETLNEIGIIRDSNNEVRIVSGRLVLKKDQRDRYVSLLPITETIEVTLTGFIYDISKTIIHRGHTLGISNEIREDKAVIEVHRGKTLVIRSQD